jgi:hypothetical protein
MCTKQPTSVKKNTTVAHRREKTLRIPFLKIRTYSFLGLLLVKHRQIRVTSRLLGCEVYVT